MSRSLVIFLSFHGLLTVQAIAQTDTLVLNATFSDPNCFESTGWIRVIPYGGVAPFTYLWPDGFTGDERTDLAGGTYTITATDATGDTDQRTVTLVAGHMHHPGMTSAGHYPCPGEANGSVTLLNSGAAGMPPYQTSVRVNGDLTPPSGTDANGDPMYDGLSFGDMLEWSVVDALGCVGQGGSSVYGPQDHPLLFTDIVPACGAMDGSVHVMAADWPTDISVVRSSDHVQVAAVTGAYNWDVTLPAGDYLVMRNWTQSMLNVCEPSVQTFTMPDLGLGCGTVSGTSWYDVNGDCIQDQDEVSMPYKTLLIQPDELYAITDDLGRYTCRVGNGAHTLQYADPLWTPVCPATDPVPFTMNGDPVVVDLAAHTTMPMDLVAYATWPGARPGFQTGISALVRNLMPYATGPITVTLAFDAALDLLQAIPTQTGTAGNILTWELPALGPFEGRSFEAALLVPLVVPLGTVLHATFTVTGVAGEDVGNNTVHLSVTTVGSHDPNEKTVRTSSGSGNGIYDIEEDHWLDYTIRFQNTGTAEAIDVVVTDTLAPDLDMASFEQGVASHDFTVAFRPGRVVEWRFANILLPDSNSNEPESHGLVQFRIKPLAPLVPGTVIANNADIFFDFNPPVRTNDAVVTVEFGTGVAERPAEGMQLFPSPAEDVLTVVLSRKLSAPVQVDLLSLDGRLVRSERVRAEQGRMALQVAGLAPGAYVLCLQGQGYLTKAMHFLKR